MPIKKYETESEYFSRMKRKRHKLVKEKTKSKSKR